jgi:uncharacterized protein (TIGR02757 family)
VPAQPLLLKPVLDRLYLEFDCVESASDPVHLVRRYEDPADREVVGFCAAALAFGRVASVLASIERLLAVMGPAPARFVDAFEPAAHRRAFTTLGHRWTRGVDLAALVWILRRMRETSGSIERFFLEGYRSDAVDVGAALDSFCERALAFDRLPVYGRASAPQTVQYFFPRPAAGSGCKRLNLFLRWMVRRDRIDLGVWTRVAPAHLVMPLDTHVIRVGRCLALTRYASPGWRMAREITDSLRALDPADPVKYDFSLCHLGMMNACGFSRPQGGEQCPLRGHCGPAGRTRRSSRRPSGRR